MDGGKREYRQKRYLLWKLRDLLEIINKSKIIINENFSSSQKLLSMNSQFTKYATSSKCIRRWLTTVTSHALFSERNKFKFEIKWYIITHCSRSGWNTHTQFEFKKLHAWKLSQMFRSGTIVIWFQSRCSLDLLFIMATGTKNDRQS